MKWQSPMCSQPLLPLRHLTGAESGWRSLWENRKFAEDFIREEIPELRTVSADATYLLWIDCNALPGDLSELAEFIRKESGLYVCDGREYGNGYGFLRMNLACRRELLKEGLERLKRSIHSYRKGISNGII